MKPSLLTLLFAVLCPAFNHALAFPAFSPYGRTRGDSMKRVRAHRKGTNIGRVSLVVVRGGGNDDSESDEYEYDASSSDDELTDDEIGEDKSSNEEDDKAEEIELMYKKAELSQQSRNFAITTALWSSLFFDSILNKVKRNDLYSTLGQGADIVTPAASLASGFALSSCVAFLMWRDLETRSETLGGDSDSKKGDWFLSLSNINGQDGEPDKFVSETRQRLLLHMVLFGVINLFAHVGAIYTDQAPFLGMSAAIINVHNTLACVSALLKEKSISELLSWPLNAFRGNAGEKREAKKGLIPFTFYFLAVSMWMRCIPVCKSIFAIATELAASDSITLVEKARELALTVASLARLTLAAGVSGTLYSAYANCSESIRNHPFFSTLCGMLSMIFLGLGGSLLFLNVSKDDIWAKGAPFLLINGTIAGFHSIRSFIASKGRTV